jgi:hypothetical protein
MLRKLAIFVEGQTELIFVQRYVEEIAGAHRISFATAEYHETILGLRLTPSSGAEDLFVLIVNCGNDEKVASVMLESYARLKAEGYERVLGLRDLFPKRRSDLARILADSHNLMQPYSGEMEVYVAVEEIEAWFLQEEFHYLRIDPSITKDRIRHALNFDINSQCAEQFRHPAKLLDRAYQLGGARYRKKKWEATRTSYSLDYNNLYINLTNILPSLARFTMAIDAFVAP